MIRPLRFDFIVNKPTISISIVREFLADRELVWDCYTKSELLDQWFAPSPLVTKTKSMDFRVGGHWHHCIIEPGGREHWGYTRYLKIIPGEFFHSTDAFSNAKGEMLELLPRATWHASFSEKRGIALVETLITYGSLSDLDVVIDMGMKQGVTSTWERLEALLSNFKE